MKLTTSFVALTLALAVQTANADLSQGGDCPTGVASCVNQNQNSGDVSNVTNSGDTSSSASQLGNSSASNVSGTTVNPNVDIKPQVTQNSTNTTTGGDDVSWSESNSSASGNRLDNDNDNRSSVGNTTSSSGGNLLGNTSNNDIGIGGQESNNKNTNKLGQGQSNDHSGNSSNDIGIGMGQSVKDSGNASQGQTQGISESGNSRNKNSAAQGQSSSNNVGLSVDASDRSSYKNETNVDARTLVMPSIPETPASVTAVGNIVQNVMACGPLQSIVRTPVNGHFFGFFSNSEFDLSYSETLIPYFDENGVKQYYEQIGERYFGHQVITNTAILGTAAARNLSIAGSGSSMSSGQVGGGASSSVQAMVTHIQLRTCEVPARVVYSLPTVPNNIRQ